MMMESIPSGTILQGKYRVERMLGTGGFGHVYLAVDLHTNQQYALKEYFVSGSSGQAQLQHEASVLNQLHHPNLPAFREAFSERGHNFVVLTYIDGSDLTDLIRIARQRNEIIPLARILGWMLSICDAVAFLHSHNPPLIHRDIKPDNIRITLDGTAVLVDLGNAKAAADGARTLFFIRHQGTPGYAPQEQYPGGTGTDTRSDIYALGGTLYFALTTHEPPNVSVRTQSAQQGLPDLPSLQEQLANNPPQEAESTPGRQFRASNQQRQGKPWQRHVRHLAQLGTLSPQLLDQLNRIIARAMAMRPRDRYQSVVDLSADLRRVLASLPASTSPSTPPPRAIDPNSTQPELQLLFEAYQEAKEQAASSSSSQAQPPAQPQPQAKPATTVACPRCGAPIVPSASFCPRCGSELKPRLQQPASSADAEPKAIFPTLNTGSAPDVSLENTMLIRPQRQAATQVRPEDQTTITSPPVQLPHPSLPQSEQQKAPAAPSSQPPSTPMPGAGSNSQQRGQASRSSIFIGLVILVAVIIVVLLVIMIVLLANHSHTTSHTFWQFISMGDVLKIGTNEAKYGLLFPVFSSLFVLRMFA